MSWTTNDIEPQHDGTVAGDGTGEAWSVRWIKDNGDGTFGVITTYWYTVDMAQRQDVSDPSEGTFDVENRTDFRVCTDPNDPGGSEIRSDDQVSEGLPVWFVDEDEADRWAKQQCADEIRNFERNYSWNGLDAIRR